MCGIVGVSGIEDAARQAYLAMYALQHRGQEAAGIVAFENGAISSHKGRGLVSEVFDTDALEQLKGDTAVGHVRYSTAGGNDVANVQPLTVKYASGDLALAHNGNLTNHRDLRERLVEEGAIVRSSADSETWCTL